MYKYLLDLLNNRNDEIIVKDFRKIISNLKGHEISLAFKNKYFISLVTSHDLFFQNLDIIKKIITDNIIFIVNNIFNYDEEYILKNRYKLFHYYFSGDFYQSYIKFCNLNFKMTNEEIFNYFKDNDIKLEENFLFAFLMDRNSSLALSNIEYFINNSLSLINLKSLFEDYNIDKKYIDIVNKKIDDNPELVTREIVSQKIDYDSLKDENILPFLNRVIYELKENENVNYHDIEYVDAGGYSAVYKIGNKVLKIGDKRVTFHIKNNKRFLKPLYRQEIKSTKNNEFLFCIEITEYIDTNNITEEDVYRIFKEFRDQGIIWIDPSPYNAGKLIRDNKVYFKEIDYVDKQATGYLTDNNYILKAGDFVFSDNDMLFDEDDETYEQYCSDEFFEYEQRYIQEKFASVIKPK